MRIAFVVNDIQTEFAAFTTTHLTLTAVNRGHDVFYINVGDFALHHFQSQVRAPTEFTSISERITETNCQRNN